MRRLTDGRWEGLHWERLEDRYEFHLVASGEVLATYALVNKKGVIAEGSTERGSWLFGSQGHLHITYVVREPRSRAVVGQLPWRRGKGGVFEVLHGRQFELRRGRGKREPWLFLDQHNEEVVRIQPLWGKRYRLDVISGGEVAVSPSAWHLGELDLLLLTGWFAMSWPPLIQEKTVRESPGP